MNGCTDTEIARQRVGPGTVVRSLVFSRVDRRACALNCDIPELQLLTLCALKFEDSGFMILHEVFHNSQPLIQ